MIRVLSSEYEDIFGNVLTFYQANLLDRVLCRFEIELSIQLTSSNSQLVVISLSPNQLQLYSGSWLDSGFRVGQTVNIIQYNASGVAISTHTTTVTSIIGGVIGLNTMPGGLANGQMFDSVNKIEITSTSIYDQLDALSNHVQNSVVGSSESLIDGQNTILRFDGLNSAPISTIINAYGVGKLSGQFDCYGNLTYDSISGGKRYYTLELEIWQSGLFDPNSFLGSSCYKHFLKLEARVTPSEPFGISSTTYSQSANTGYLNEAYNIGVVDSVLQGVNILSVNGGLNYDQSTNVRFTIETSSTEIQIGAVYVPLDDSYNHNKYESQSNLCMLSESYAPFTNTVYSSKTNPSGANYTLTTGTVTVISPTEKEYQVIFNPNTAFTNFMESKPDGDRRMIIWFKAGNVNHTIFDGQMNKAVNVWGDLELGDICQFLRHDENQTTPVTDNWFSGITRITEDDLGYLLNFVFDKSIFYKEVKVFIEAYKSATGERFTLEEASFDLSATPVVSGKQLIDLQLGVSNNLPTTSAKKQAFLINDDALIDTISEYGVRLYYPFLLKWQYWNIQSGVNPDFFPYKGQDWFTYDDLSGWNIQITTQAITDNDKTFSFSNPITIRTYEDNSFIEHERSLHSLDGTEVTSFIDGQIIEIRYKWTAIFPLDGIDMYGTITIEPEESNPRFLISTKVQHDFDVNNPLQPITGNLATVTLLASNSVQVSCYIDCNKLDLSKNVSVGAFIALNPATSSDFILQEDNFFLLQEDNDKLIIE
jgi:hypothetical protein